MSSDPTEILPLAPAQLRRACDAARLPFATTEALDPLAGILSQSRAVEALEFGLRMRRANFNVFVLGSPGIGKRATIDHLTRSHAAAAPTPSDWVYVYNFAEARRPRALALPPGRGAQLRQAMANLIDELRAAVPAVFESDDYRTRRQIIDDEFKHRQDAAFKEIEHDARQHQIAIIRTPLGVGLAVLHDGQILPPDEFSKLPARDQEKIQAEMTRIHAALEGTFKQLPKWESERHQKVRELNRTVVKFAIGHLIGTVKDGFKDLPNVAAYLDQAEQDLIENAGQFLIRARLESEMPVEGIVPGTETEFLNRYLVNLFVDRSGTQGAPIVDEDHPTVPNLIGRVEFRPHFGTLVTDFTLIRAGALHQANGGYLVLDTRRVLLQPFAWETLKRILRAREIRIQSVAEMAGLMSGETLQPEPIPLDVKIILTGEREIYYLLCALDPDFRELFKVAADFDDEIGRDADSELGFARLIARFVKANGLRPLDRDAVARIIDQAARMAGDAEKLSVELEAIVDLVREADFVAQERKADVVTAADVENAIQAQIRRASRIRDRLQEAMARGVTLIDTAGTRVGQINGLSVLNAGGFLFGQPNRITASVRLGKGEVIDIEREVKLGGPLHSKGVLILGGYVSEKFGRRLPLALSASIVFEQSYGGVEGDSASLAELLALLSAIAGVALRQDLAVTGSVNQHGDVQAIGGVNEKIEGFFDVCKARGLTGRQGVLIPKTNTIHLMLRQDVVDAVTAGKFGIYAVRTVDEALALLSGMPSGERAGDGAFPDGTLNRKIEAELGALAETAQKFAARAEGKATS